jgi:hypothetical protein
MEDVLAVYHLPYDPNRPVVCLDECSKELHSSPRPDLDAQPGKTACQDYEYARQGTRNLFLWTEPLAGRRKVRVTERRTAIDFAEQLRLLVDADYPDAQTIVLVTDNLNTHTPACLYERFSPEEARRIIARIEWHYTPEHASWLNMAEIELSALSRQCLNRRIPDADTLAAEIEAWETERNHANVQIHWRFTVEDARIKLRTLYPVMQEITT